MDFPKQNQALLAVVVECFDTWHILVVAMMQLVQVVPACLPALVFACWGAAGKHTLGKWGLGNDSGT